MMKINIDETELARLEELAGKATTGPWTETTDPSHFYTLSTVLGGEKKKSRGLHCQLIVQVGGWANIYEQEANTCYIAAACNAVPALVAEIRRLRACKTISFEDFEHHLKSAQAKEIESLREKVEAWRDAAEFEATVTSKLARLDAEDLPCANSMVMFCPKPPFRGRNCGPWCLLRMAMLNVEEEMEKHADRE